MRRSLILSMVLAASVAVLGACDPKTEVPNKPVGTPVPVATASPTASPVPSPVKPATSPEVKKADDKNVNKDAKPVETPKAK
ncbi:MAG: hypothetical protein ABIO36_07045 [Pyrinomonadaceae bacterium]